MILVMDTSATQAFLGLWEDGWRAEESWEAGRNLSRDIIEKLEEIYKKAGITTRDTEKIIVNSGPGSFTGLRIGLSIANTLAYANNIPIVGVENQTKTGSIVDKGVNKLKNKKEFSGSVLPMYGAEPKITRPKGVR